VPGSGTPVDSRMSLCTVTLDALNGGVPPPKSRVVTSWGPPVSTTDDVIGIGRPARSEGGRPEGSLSEKKLKVKVVDGTSPIKKDPC